jgi:hypothetical protein
MRELERTGVERKALHRIGLRSVFFVAYDRTPGISELHSDLMPASGFQRQLDESATLSAR